MKTRQSASPIATTEAATPDVFEPSADVLRFYDELIQRYPELGAYREASDRSEALWTVSPERSDRVIELCIKWGAPDEALDFIVDLARKYDLVLYDPQGPSVHWPEPPKSGWLV